MKLHCDPATDSIYVEFRSDRASRALACPPSAWGSRYLVREDDPHGGKREVLEMHGLTTSDLERLRASPELRVRVTAVSGVRTG